MTDETERKRAAGYVDMYESATDTQALFFGRCGVDPSEIFYRVTRSTGREPGERLGLLVRGDFSPILDAGLLGDPGRRPLALQGRWTASRSPCTSSRIRPGREMRSSARAPACTAWWSRHRARPGRSSPSSPSSA